ncbi:MAG: GTP-sensing pleiotropic transcriptional regulator CodY [Clostridia bacterium]|nr:GTP-sensing pleiotropic transcriptional regulator CodY [Clostridia bacterium]
MGSLLERSRKINRLLQRAAGNPVDFQEMANVMRDVLGANTYIVGRHARVLGYAFVEGFTCDVMEEIVFQTERFPEQFNEQLLRIDETQANFCQVGSVCVFDQDTECVFSNKLTTVVPVIGGGQRLGTLVLSKFNVKFEDEDLVLAEYGATVVGMEILRSKADKIEEEARNRAAVHIALGTLSYSELEAIEHIFAELDGDEGILVASKIADRAGITRSVIVNALRKFESAGVIESKSLGMKGTYIRVLNDHLLEELEKMRR